MTRTDYYYSEYLGSISRGRYWLYGYRAKKRSDGLVWFIQDSLDYCAPVIELSSPVRVNTLEVRFHRHGTFMR